MSSETFIEDGETGRRVIVTDRKKIAEAVLHLKGRPLKLDNYRPFHAIYRTSAQNLVIQAGRQVSKCGTGENMIPMFNGMPARLGALRPGDKVLSLASGYRLVTGQVSDTIQAGRKPCVRLTTRLGHELEVARSHPIRGLFDYYPAGELKIGDRVAAVRRGGSFTDLNPITPTEAMVLAYMIGDGSAQGKQNFGFTNSKPEILAEFRSCCAMLGQVAPREYERKGSLTLRLSLASDAPVRRLLEHQGIYGKTSETKFIPAEVFDLDRERTALFLNRLWACDGHAKQLNPGKYEIHYATISKKLAHGVQALLWKFGIPASVSRSQPKVYIGTNKFAYKVRIETQEGIRRFLTEIGAFMKSESIPLPAAESNNNRDTIPQDVQKLITALYERALARDALCGPGRAGRPRASITDHGLRATLKYPPSPRKIAQYVEFFQQIGLGDEPETITLESLINNDVIWDKIIAIEDIGMQDCYDIEVDVLHNYILGGVVTHNSTTLGNWSITDAIGVPHSEQLIVLPSIMQMRRFSSDKVGKIVATSPLVKKWFVDHTCERAIYKRSFLNGSTMEFAAMTQMESIRGGAKNRVSEDEVQDMDLDALAIVEEVLSGQASDKIAIARTGTAKTVGNTLDVTFKKSSQCEWIVPCPSGHHNVPSPDNIGDRGFICKKCRSLCDVRGGYWRSMAGLDAEWMGFHIPQIILPLHTEDQGNWRKLLRKRNGGVSPVVFLNEVMGIPAGSGITALTEEDLIKCCEPVYEIDPHYFRGKDHDIAVVFGTCDWGLMAIKSFTIASIWGITKAGRIKLLFAYRFLDPDPYKQVEQIIRLFTNAGVELVGCDWGMGMIQSRIIEEQMPQVPVHRFMYVGEQRALMSWYKEGKLWRVNRTQAMTEAFVWMKRQRFWFPNWSWFKEYIAPDILCIYEEAVNQVTFKNDVIRYAHPDSQADDATHTCVYALLLLWILYDRGRTEFHLAG